MDFPKWAYRDGENLANIIYENLLEKGELTINEILDIYDTCDFPILKKTEGACWAILYAMNVKRENGRVILIKT